VSQDDLEPMLLIVIVLLVLSFKFSCIPLKVMLFPQIVRLLIVIFGLKSYDLKYEMSETKVEFVSLNPY
jgi:hypothetical protein